MQQEQDRPKRKREKWHPPPYDQESVRAVQALAAGEASEQQQIHALNYIIEVCAGTYDEPFTHGDPHTSAYMMGRRSVGLAIVKAIKISHKVFER